MGRIANAVKALRGAKLASPRKRNAFAAGGAGRLISSFSGTSLSADESVVRNLRTMRNRSRQLANDNEYMKRFLQMVSTNVVGPTGVQFQSRAVRPNGQLDTIDNDAIEAAFRRFSKRGNFEVTGRLGRAASERMLIQQVARDGEILVRKRPGYSRSDSEYALQFLDPDLLDETLNRERMPGGMRIRMGVELDGDGWPVAYYLLRRHPGESQQGFIGADLGHTHQRIPASEMLHLFVPFRAGQNRGIPWAHASILALNAMGEYRASAMVAARVGADKVAFFTGDDIRDDGDAYDSNGDIEMPSGAGEFGRVPDGTGLLEWDPNYPHEQFEQFNKAMLRGIAGGLGVAYNGFANDLQGVNFSSIRAGVIDERDNWMVIQNWLTESFHDGFFTDWLTHQLMRGAIGSIPINALERKNFPVWQAKRWQWVDPLKDVQANREAYDLRVKSLSQIIRELGHDPDDVWREIEADTARLAELGITNQAPALAGVSDLEDGDDE